MRTRREMRRSLSPRNGESLAGSGGGGVEVRVCCCWFGVCRHIGCFPSAALAAARVQACEGGESACSFGTHVDLVFNGAARL